MAFLTIAGINVDAVTTGVHELPSIEVGKSKRAFAGNLRTSIRSVKRMWSFTTRDMTDTEITALQAAAPHGAFAACSGDSLPAAATYEVTYKGGPFVETGAPYYKRQIEIQVAQV